MSKKIYRVDHSGNYLSNGIYPVFVRAVSEQQAKFVAYKQNSFYKDQYDKCTVTETDYPVESTFIEIFDVWSRGSSFSNTNLYVVDAYQFNKEQEQKRQENEKNRVIPGVSNHDAAFGLSLEDAASQCGHDFIEDLLFPDWDY